MPPTSHVKGLTPKEVTSSELLADLRALGVTSGARIVVHASLRSLGWVIGGADAVVDALEAAVTERGLLLMPTFNHGAPFARGGPGVYDPECTPSASGAVSDAFWRRPEVSRSLHPTHSFAAFGRGARELLEGHELGSTLGPSSPLGRLADLGGSILHLGTTHRVSSAKHLAETLHEVPCLEEGRDLFPVRLPSGVLRSLPSWRYRSRPCPLTESGEHIASALERRGLQRLGRVGAARASLVSLAACVAAVSELLEQGSPPWPPCTSCSIRPGDRREGDWD
jgi:aminoglycoside 3-N-acetyltransferase